jgi:hypothetical protein
LRDHVNPTFGFERLADEVGRPAKSLQRTLGASRNPTAENLVAFLKILQEWETVEIKVRLKEDPTYRHEEKDFGLRSGLRK